MEKQGPLCPGNLNFGGRGVGRHDRRCGSDSRHCPIMEAKEKEATESSQPLQKSREDSSRSDTVALAIAECEQWA